MAASLFSMAITLLKNCPQEETPESPKADEQPKSEVAQPKIEPEPITTKQTRKPPKLVKKILNTLRSAQIYPSHGRVEPNDKDTKVLFGIKDEHYQQLLDGTSRNIVENRNHKKHGTIKTPYSISNSDCYNNKIPLNEFDRALIGKVGVPSIKPSKKQEQAILVSIEKLMFTNFNPDTQAPFKKLSYSENGDSIRIKKSQIFRYDSEPAQRFQPKQHPFNHFS